MVCVAGCRVLPWPTGSSIGAAGAPTRMGHSAAWVTSGIFRQVYVSTQRACAGCINHAGGKVSKVHPAWQPLCTAGVLQLLSQGCKGMHHVHLA